MHLTRPSPLDRRLAAVAARRAQAGAVLDRLLRDSAPARRLRLGLVLDVLEGLGEGRRTVLDAGCGEGLLSMALARRRPAWTIVGVDRDDRILGLAEAERDAAGAGNVEFRRGDLTEPVGDAAFDAVVAVECLTEIEADDAVLASLSHALRPGGLFVVHVPDRTWRPFLPGSETRWRHEVRHGYTPALLASKLRRAGLAPTAIVPTTRNAVQLAQDVRDRLKRTRPLVRLALHPLMAGAVWLERHGLRWGEPQAWLVTAERVARASTDVHGA